MRTEANTILLRGSEASSGSARWTTNPSNHCCQQTLDNHSLFSLSKKCKMNLMGRMQFVRFLYASHSGYRSIHFSFVMIRVANTLVHTYSRMSQGSQCYKEEGRRSRTLATSAYDE